MTVSVQKRTATASMCSYFSVHMFAVAVELIKKTQSNEVLIPAG